jgi:hypothetical protein
MDSGHEERCGPSSRDAGSKLPSLHLVSTSALCFVVFLPFAKEHDIFVLRWKGIANTLDRVRTCSSASPVRQAPPRRSSPPHPSKLSQTCQDGRPSPSTQPTMILRNALLFTLSSLLRHAVGQVAPESTIVADGYNVIAKLPCTGCPFLYQDTSEGKDGPWKTRNDENALVNSHLSCSCPNSRLTSVSSS